MYFSKSKENLYYQYFKTPLGFMKSIGDSKYLISLEFASDELSLSDKDGMINSENAILKQTKEELKAYFQGNLYNFTVPYSFHGTDFQKKVWSALADIPYGETISYEELATRIGNPKACRAVGQTNNKNPIAIIVPCHRVVGKNGKLVGYGGGIDKKEWLLSLEKNPRSD